MLQMIKHSVTKPISLVLGVVLCPLWCHADPISYNQAKDIAGRYVTLPADRQDSSLTRANGGESYEPFYIFNDAQANNGFVIIAGNNDINPVLGYSGTGHIDEANMPDGLRFWLENIQSVKSTTKSSSEKAEVVVAPLIKTRWYQTAPYNLKSPEGKCLTGCAATAMAQVMNYHQWPEKGHGFVKYESYAPFTGEDNDPGAGWLSTDFSQSTYDWGHMKETYQDNKWTDTEAEAVSTLMRDCGYAAYMQYRYDESSSYDVDAATALTEHFGYDTEIVPHFGDHNTEQWLAKIKEELDEKFPVLISGQSTLYGKGGHFFIADGYDSHDFLHINWGWNGDADGFYNIAALTPIHGESPNNFSYMQYFTSVRPRKPYTDATYNPAMIMLWNIKDPKIDNSGLTVENSGAVQSIGQPVNIKIEGLCFVASRGFEGKFELALIDEKGETVRTLFSQEVEREPLSSSFENQGIDLNSITIPANAFKDTPNGKYTLFPMSTYKDMPAKRIQTYGYKGYLNVTVSDGKITLSNVSKPVSDLRYTSPFTLPAEMPMYSKLETVINLENKGDYIEGGFLDVVMYSQDRTKSWIIYSTAFAIYEKQQMQIPVSTSLLPLYNGSDNKVSCGEEYTIELEYTDTSHQPIRISNPSEFPKVLITDRPELRPYVEITSLQVTDEDGISMDLGNLNLSAEKSYDIQYDYKIVAPGATPPSINYNVNLEGLIWGERSAFNKPEGSINTSLDFFFIDYETGETYLSIEYFDPVTGEYILCSPSELSRIKVTIYDNATAIEKIIPQTEVREVARYNLSGVKLKKPVQGINIIQYSDGSTRKEFVNIKE